MEDHHGHVYGAQDGKLQDHQQHLLFDPHELLHLQLKKHCVKHL